MFCERGVITRGWSYRQSVSGHREDAVLCLERCFGLCRWRRAQVGLAPVCPTTASAAAGVCLSFDSGPEDGYVIAIQVDSSNGTAGAFQLMITADDSLYNDNFTK